MITCHDCHSENEVRAPKVRVDRADKPTLVGAEDFQLSAPVERPKFSPVEQTRRDEDEDDEFRLAPLPPEPPAATVPPMNGGVSSSAVSTFQPGTFAPNFRLSPTADPVPGVRPTTAPANAFPPASPAATAPAAALPPRRQLPRREESYGDELWDAPVDPNQPRFHRGPFLIGIVEFLFYPGTMSRWLVFTALAAIPIAAIELAVAASIARDGNVFSPAGIFFTLIAAGTGFVWLLLFSLQMQAVVEDTGRGCDAIEKWPTAGFIPHGNPLYLPAAIFLGMLPGLIVWMGYHFGQDGLTVFGGIIALISLLIFVPLLWLPILLHKSFAGAHQSPLFWESFRFTGDGWIVFYMETFVLGLVVSMGISLWSTGSVVVAPLSAALLVTPLFLYFRLLGRLLWYIDPAMTPVPPPPKEAPAPLPETVDPTQLRR
ncbi:hypothetical protein ETAA8_54870 [Anatilimnocola aggregata]|uniref:Uncharacterized protein n=2 Tax=Anatilimnocola aggregata TaxID=2528021 RepID=A0A517YJG0_9BACT|nr:hypothetical protein ETAA8_54870 [Anatilimnocola aggregata]